MYAMSPTEFRLHFHDGDTRMLSLGAFATSESEANGLGQIDSWSILPSI